MENEDLLKREAEAFDDQVEERIQNGFVPDLRKIQKVEWFYNNVWMDLEYIKIHLMPKVNFVLDIAKQKGGKVIELGCGHGYLSLELARNGLDVTGVDLSPNSIKVAQRFADTNFENGSLNYVCDNTLTIDLGKEQYDSIIFFGSLHHLPDTSSVIKKVHEALKIGGNLIVCEPLEDNFTTELAQFAAILRVVLPTWEPTSKKLQGLDNSQSWENYVQEIYDEYTYQNEHEQSPMDNVSSDEEMMLEPIKKLFTVKNIEYSDAFIDKLIGGLRGENKYELAKFLKFLDNELIRKKVFPATFMMLHAVKER